MDSREQLLNEKLSAAEAVKNQLLIIGEDPEREGLLETPARVIRSWDELYGGYKVKNPKEILTPIFLEDYDEIVTLSFEFFSTCEHHMLPFFGNCHIAYIPDGKIVGISKLARLTECLARRLQIQERLTKQIAEIISDVLKPIGTGVIMIGQHFCMTNRGIKKQHSKMRTSSMHGVFREKDNPARQEFLEIIKCD